MMQENARKRDILSGAVWLALGLFGLISSLRLGVGNVRDPGSGFVLFCASILFIGCIVLMLILNHFNRRGFTSSDAWQGVRRRPVFIVVTASVLYLFVLERLGYLLATFALMLLLFGVSRMKLWRLLICTLSTVGSSYYIFHSLLKVPLPKGLLGF